MWGLTIASLAAFAAGANAGFLRFACSQLVIQRLDPLVNPGMIPSTHVHQIIGGNSFNASMDPNIDIAESSTCTSCTFTQDFSNYWTATLYYRAPNGTFRQLPLMENQFLEGAKGGMTVYYVSSYGDNGNMKLQAFKQGFRMLAGNPERREKEQGMVNLYRCYDGKPYRPNPGGVAATDTSDLPTRYCAGGIRVNIFFPTCWDGKTLDSADHQSHVRYPTSGDAFGECPITHPVHLPQIFLESLWDTSIFSPDEWPTDGTQPLLWSSGDPSGFGHHADYVFGWKGDSLQKAMDSRCSGLCTGYLETQPEADANSCTMDPIVTEDVGRDGWISELPGIPNSMIG